MALAIDAPALRARAELEARLLAHPAVRLIDVGRERSAGSASPGSIVLRVHLDPGTDRGALPLPAEVDGFPVRVVTGDYRSE